MEQTSYPPPTGRADGAYKMKEIVKHFTTPKLMELCAGLVGEVLTAAVSGFVQGVEV